MAAEAPPRSRSSHPQLWTDDLRDDVLGCQATVAKAGLEMLVERLKTVRTNEDLLAEIGKA